MDNLAPVVEATDIPTKQHVDERVAKTGDVMTGNLTISKASAELIVDGSPSAGSNAQITLKGSTGTMSRRIIQALTGGSLRWTMRMGTNDPETGANAGSNFLIYCYDDAGALLGTPLYISRATGLITVMGDPTAALGVATKQYVDGKTGITDHGALTGLADDDHPQYHTDARGDARYAPAAHNHDARYVNTTGDDMMTGNLTMSGDNRIVAFSGQYGGLHWPANDAWLANYNEPGMYTGNTGLPRPFTVGAPSAPSHAATKQYTDFYAGAKSWALGAALGTVVGNGAATVISIGVDGWETGWTATGYRIVLPQDGWYMISGTFRFADGNPGGQRRFFEVVSTYAPSGSLARASVGHGEDTATVTCLAYQPPSSQVWFQAYQDSGGTKTVGGGYWHIKFLGN